MEHALHINNTQAHARRDMHLKILKIKDARHYKETVPNRRANKFESKRSTGNQQMLNPKL